MSQTDRPWENEADRLDFDAEGLKCAMRRNHRGVWCGYVGVGPEHPLHGLPTNHVLKLPPSWFKGRKLDQGHSPFDLFIHIAKGAESLDDGCPISLALHVHGGCNWSKNYIPDEKPDGRWWFGFDCGHAHDLAPDSNETKLLLEMVESMPEEARETMRDIVLRERRDAIYRDQQYVVSECQSLAAQLVAVVDVLRRENGNARADRH